MACLLKKRRVEKQLFAWARKGKRQPAKEKAPRIKEMLTPRSGVVVAEGRDEVDVDVGEWEPGVLITSPSDSVSVSEG
jgi:hypothetical protein